MPMTASLTKMNSSPSRVGLMLAWILLSSGSGEFADVDDVPLQAEAERAARNRPRLEHGGADAVVVECDLVISEQVRFHHRRSGIADHQSKGVDAKQQSRRAAACR